MSHLFRRLFTIAAFVLLATPNIAAAKNLQRTVLAGGCFWCVEKDFDHVKGVVKTTSGYIGGKVKNPTYKQVTKGGTGHYEAVEIVYDADVVTFDQLLYVFWRTVDPTDAGGQPAHRSATRPTPCFLKCSRTSRVILS